MSDSRSLQELCGKVSALTRTLQKRGDAAYLAGKGLFDEFMDAVKMADGKNEDEAVRLHLEKTNWAPNALDFLATHEMMIGGK